MGAPRTEAAIRQVSEMIASASLLPGERLPPEAELAERLGASRNTVREAVRALVTARVLDVRRGDGTYVTSLRPELLLEGIAFAADLMQPDFSIELVEVRRILEPAAAAMAARRVDADDLAELRRVLDRMRSARGPEALIRADSEFHALVARASGNATLASMLAGISGRTVRARVWRGIVEGDAVANTIAQHEHIQAALAAGDPILAEAASLIHVATTEAWMRRLLAERPANRAGTRQDAAVAETATFDA
jgi:GntR family transcriptional repressor for pyruvate dehydrogenase complex